VGSSVGRPRTAPRPARPPAAGPTVSRVTCRRVRQRPSACRWRSNRLGSRSTAATATRAVWTCAGTRVQTLRTHVTQHSQVPVGGTACCCFPWQQRRQRPRKALAWGMSSRAVSNAAGETAREGLYKSSTTKLTCLRPAEGAGQREPPRTPLASTRIREVMLCCWRVGGWWWWWWCGQPRPPSTATAQLPPLGSLGVQVVARHVAGCGARLLADWVGWVVRGLLCCCAVALCCAIKAR
jgi:hypothetical protein